MLTVNQQINAIHAYLGKKISKAWIKGNLAKYLAMYRGELSESGMINLPESSKKSIAKKAKELAQDIVTEIKESVTVAISDIKDAQTQDNKEEADELIQLEEDMAVAKKTEYPISDVKIQMQYSAEALLAGKKTQHRADYNVQYIKRIRQDMARGCVFPVTDSPSLLKKSCTAVWHPVAYIKINSLYKQKLVFMTYDNLCAEGFPNLSVQDYINEYYHGDNSQRVWVFNFEVVKMPDEGEHYENSNTKSSVEIQQPNTSITDPPQETEPANLAKLKISFALTSSVLLSGKKTQTRRVWSDFHVKKIKKICEQGKLIAATDKSSRFGGKPIAYLKITNLYQQKLADITQAEVIAEGFPDFSPKDFINQFFSGDDTLQVWVVNFEVVKILKTEVTKDAKINKKSVIKASPLSAQIQKKKYETLIKNAQEVNQETSKKRAKYLVPLPNFNIPEKVLYDESFLSLNSQHSVFYYQEALKRFLYLKINHIENTWNLDYSSICEKLKQIDDRLKNLPLKNWWQEAYKVIHPEFKNYCYQYYYQQLPC